MLKINNFDSLSAQANNSSDEQGKEFDKGKNKNTSANEKINVMSQKIIKLLRKNEELKKQCREKLD